MKLLLNTFLTSNKFMSEKHPRDSPFKFSVFLSQKQNTKNKKLGQMVITEYVYRNDLDKACSNKNIATKIATVTVLNHKASTFIKVVMKEVTLELLLFLFLFLFFFFDEKAQRTVESADTARLTSESFQNYRVLSEKAS